jgi:hypothetical protein
MLCKTLTTVSCVVVGASLLGWYDRLHLVVGLPLLGLGALGSLWLHQRLHHETDEAEETLDVDPEGRGHQIAMGALYGVLALCLLAVAFSVTARTGLAALVQGPDCQALLEKLTLLEEGKAYAAVVERVDSQLQRPLFPDCHRALLAKRFVPCWPWHSRVSPQRRQTCYGEPRMQPRQPGIMTCCS